MFMSTVTLVETSTLTFMNASNDTHDACVANYVFMEYGQSI